MLLTFLKKRVFLIAGSFALIAFFLTSFQVEIPFGIILGVLFCSIKTSYLAKILEAFSKQGYASKPTTVIWQVLSQGLSLALLGVCIYLEFNLFVGAVIGVLIQPFYICFNTFTEKIGITRNNWGLPL